MLKTLALAAALLLASLPAIAAAPVGSVPYRVDYDGWIIVPVRLNGSGPYDFVVDTGATHSIVFETLAREQGLALSGGPDQTVIGLRSDGLFPTYDIGDLDVGGAALPDLVSVVLADWSVDRRAPRGVLGLDFLSRFYVVFDAGAGEARFYARADRPEPPESWKKIDLHASDFGLGAGLLYTVNGTINGRTFPFLLDLGAHGAMINHRAFNALTRDQLSITVTTFGGRQTGRITDALDQSASARGIIVERFRVGRHTWRRHPFIVYNAPIFIDLGAAGRNFGLFGADLVNDRSFSLDFEGKAMFIGPRR